MSAVNDGSSFLASTLKRRHQKRIEVTRVLQEGLSALDLCSAAPDEQQRANEGVYPLLNVDPESYLLGEGDERSMLHPNSCNDPDFKQTISVLFNWLNTSLSRDAIIVRSFENDLYDGYVLAKLIEFQQPSVRLLDDTDDVPLSEDAKKKTLRTVLQYLDRSLREQNQTIKWTFAQIYSRDLIGILHLLLTLMKFFNVKIRYNLPKNLLLKVIVVKKIEGLLQTKIVNECFIDDHQREIRSVSTSEGIANAQPVDDLDPLAQGRRSNRCSVRSGTG